MGNLERPLTIVLGLLFIIGIFATNINNKKKSNCTNSYSITSETLNEENKECCNGEKKECCSSIDGHSHDGNEKHDHSHNDGEELDHTH